MLQVVSFPEELVQETGKSPAVCLVLPFEPQIQEKSSIDVRLKAMLEKAEARLLQQYSYRKALPVLARLRQLISEVSYYNYKKSLALLATPYLSRLLYLDFPVTETIRTGEDLDIRNIIRAKSNQPHYLAMVVNTDCLDVYEGDTANLTLIKHNGRTSNNWCQQADWGLDQLLRAYRLPVLIVGQKTAIDVFQKATVHNENILTYIPCQEQLKNKEQLLSTLQPAFNHWQKHQQDYLLQKLHNAQAEQLLDVGIDQVWNAATHRRSTLLVVEENFIKLAPRVNATPCREESPAWPIADPLQQFDLVNDTIEKVLKDGGEVALLPPGSLSAFQHIALIESCHHSATRKV
ncbi:hypothetical protein [Paraflavitalea pollutisoli]|uniref:baeRF3 domain-containing protein n=1 Tax=Paraflavitalea pollutisoli TaxID=3034143 RepID=UPI0023EA9D7E|nr:hypothetical protein [Paraflavitalea sp. H1-2-19X]